MLSDEEKKFKASHFENIDELIKTCKMWIQDDDWDAYCRFFDMGAMEELINLIKKQSKEIEELKEENKKYIVQLTDEQYRKLVDIIRDETSKEWKNKIKAKIEEVNAEELNLAFIISGVEYKEAITNALQSLLEKE